MSKFVYLAKVLLPLGIFSAVVAGVSPIRNFVLAETSVLRGVSEVAAESHPGASSATRFRDYRTGNESCDGGHCRHYPAGSQMSRLRDYR